MNCRTSGELARCGRAARTAFATCLFAGWSIAGGCGKDGEPRETGSDTSADGADSGASTDAHREDADPDVSADPPADPDSDALPDLDASPADGDGTGDAAAPDSGDAHDADPLTVEPRESVRSWILLDGDPDAVVRNLEAAVAWGIDEVQLSHDITDRIEQLGSDEAERILAAIAAAHDAGLRVMLWSNEFSNVGFAVCFDPADPMWARRREDYRRALALTEAIDGVVVTMGSADPPPWFAPCACEYCVERGEGMDPADRLFYAPPPDERIVQTVQNVHDVVTGEFGRYTYVRTFIHQPAEQEYMLAAMEALDPERYFVVMSKDVPNDWEPYYPLDPAFERLASRPRIMELDAAGEYWGVSRVPFAAVGYFERRIREAQSHGLTGYAIRIERGSSSALDTPNEVNLLAIQRFFDDPSATPDTVYAEWIARRFGLESDDPWIEPLQRFHEATFEIGRRQYYQLGFWTLEKGSGLPSDCGDPAELLDRGIQEWDARWEPTFDRLRHPDVQTLADLRQEDLEALALADRNLAELGLLVERGLVGAPVDDLSIRLRKQRHQVRIWMEVVEAMWSRALYRESGELLHAGWSRSALERLEVAVGDYVTEFGADTSPLSPDDAASCGADIAADLPPDAEPVERSWPSLLAPEVAVDGDTLTVRIRATEPVIATLEWGESPPTWSHQTEPAAFATEILFIATLPPDVPDWIALRVTATSEVGLLVRGGDWWVRTR